MTSHKLYTTVPLHPLVNMLQDLLWLGVTVDNNGHYIKVTFV
jgi:hypothetical protein